MELLGEFLIGEYVLFLVWIDRICGFNDKVEEVSCGFSDFMDKVV